MYFDSSKRKVRALGNDIEKKKKKITNNRY